MGALGTEKGQGEAPVVEQKPVRPNSRIDEGNRPQCFRYQDPCTSRVLCQVGMNMHSSEVEGCVESTSILTAAASQTKELDKPANISCCKVRVEARTRRSLRTSSNSRYNRTSVCISTGNDKNDVVDSRTGARWEHTLSRLDPSEGEYGGRSDYFDGMRKETPLVKFELLFRPLLSRVVHIRLWHSCRASIEAVDFS